MQSNCHPGPSVTRVIQPGDLVCFKQADDYVSQDSKSTWNLTYYWQDHDQPWRNNPMLVIDALGEKDLKIIKQAMAKWWMFTGSAYFLVFCLTTDCNLIVVRKSSLMHLEVAA